MSSVARTVLCGGLAELMPSKTFCVMSVRRVFVECSGLYPCCDGFEGTCGDCLCEDKSYGVISVFIGSSSQISCGDLSSGPNRPTYVQSLKKFIESWLYIYGIL